MARPNQKDAILEAAQAIAIESGAVHMTLDAVAARCNISKGGLMYNYPTKDALIEAMIGRLMERHDQLRERIRQETPAGEPNELLVEIRMLMQMSEADHRLSGALLVALANRPEHIERVKNEHCKRFFGQIVTPENFERSAVLFFAALGLHFNKLLKMGLLDTEQEQRVFTELTRLAGGNKQI